MVFWFTWKILLIVAIMIFNLKLTILITIQDIPWTVRKSTFNNKTTFCKLVTVRWKNWQDTSQEIFRLTNEGTFWNSLIAIAWSHTQSKIETMLESEMAKCFLYNRWSVFLCNQKSTQNKSSDTNKLFLLF